MLHRAVGRLQKSGTVFLLCDVQEKFRPLIHEFPAMLHVCNMLVSFARLVASLIRQNDLSGYLLCCMQMRASSSLDIPVIVTEQYPKGLLHTGLLFEVPFILAAVAIF
jgi:hypothetical protein